MMMGFGFAIQGKLEADQQAGVGGKGRECPLTATFQIMYPQRMNRIRSHPQTALPCYNCRHTAWTFGPTT